MSRQIHNVLFVFIVFTTLSQQQLCTSWSIFSKSDTPSPNDNDLSDANHNDFSVAFSMDAPNNDEKGIKLVENAKNKLANSNANSCWQNAYRSLFSACSEIMSVEEKRSRLAWDLSSCFQEDSGRPTFPSCKSTMRKCLKDLDENKHKIYLAFYLETNTICQYLQSHLFKQDTERLVNELQRSAKFAEDKLDIIEEKSEHLLQSSNEIYDSLISLDGRTQQLTQASKNVQDHINVVLSHSEAVYEQSKGIAASQLQLQEGQGIMKVRLEEGMSMLHDSHDKLGREINQLRNEAVAIENELSKVGDKISSKMDTLQSKADDIENLAGVSLDKQKLLLSGQSTALESLKSLTSFQSQALEESRATLQQLAELGDRKQEELLQKQEQLQRIHDHLVENSKTMLAAQEAFELKQTSMFVALDKLFALHNAMLLESRIIKAFFIYTMSIFIIYMFTSTKQTYTVRPWLYIGLCITFLIEVSILRFAETYDIEQQSWMIKMVRSFFAALSLLQLLYAIFTYRDYEVLNHYMLRTLMEKVEGMEKRRKYEDSEDDDDDDDGWSLLMDSELPEDVNQSDDPDYMLPPTLQQVAANSITTFTKTYDLRHRHR